MRKNKLCTICMRSGSKGVKNKNYKILNGFPLMYYTIEQAKKSRLFDEIVISTDSKKIASIAKKYNIDVWFYRPRKLSGDRVGKLEVIRHALLESEKYYNKNFDIIVDLDVTSPLRLYSDINKAYKQFINKDADILISGTEARRSPYFNQVEEINDSFYLVKNFKKNIKRRQDSPKVYDMNASIYIWKKNSLLNQRTLFSSNTTLYIMPPERSIDIDSELDFRIVEYIMKKENNGN